MVKTLDYLGHYAAYFLAGSVFLGMVLPKIDGIAELLLSPLIVLMIAVPLVRADVKALRQKLARPARLFLLVSAIMLVSPVVFIIGARAIGLSGEFLLIFALLASAPPLASNPGLIALLKLDIELSVPIMLISTLIAPFSVPLVLSLFAIPIPELGREELFFRLILAIVLAIVIAVLVRRIPFFKQLVQQKQALDGISTLLLMLFAFFVLNAVNADVLQKPAYFFQTFALAFFMNWGTHFLVFMFLGFLGCLLLKRREGWLETKGSLSMLCANRNFALFMAVFPVALKQELFLFLTLAQLPIYLAPLFFKPFYQWLKSKSAYRT